ncbi:PspC family transcriptional regulator [Actinoplanes lobatus]|uniref:Phage shock protein PspC (Stress-responsive transcriptional regulator) n=1 Tax=Actinoplanes lobatus TaxID=113568 RepID=A0A7W7HE94_9ACTN|nr:PspC domain-containing protein [Actinoplanes lobatus]MBB4748567.1 phage shock protein PspC (stress-responsive transcriptional regulator) [Actinoplanes lobatus]GGN57812.1 PspC family transcriptional regulator [Actinoplanes lobatus]GIE37532.1 PspC family transcriptional regulator [Actinoplanes lobatus]
MNDEAPGAGPKGDQAPSDQPEGFPPGSNVPPWVAAASAAWSRQQLVRPRNGRYVAGVCGALARATNTDPVLWRVLLGVLGVLSGTGVLLYLIGWLIIPSEGDTSSPVESLLGKGRSGMAPLSVVLLGGAALLTFAFIVNSGARASLLAAAVVLGAFLLIKRGGATPFQAAAPPPPDAPPPATEEPTMAFVAPPAAEPAGEPVSKAGPTTGFRPPFAPHGPFAGPPTAPPPVPPMPPRPPMPPKPPRERSILGRLTFFAVVMVTGLIAAIDMSGVDVAISAYFAAALTTTALGLIVGAWFGRARGLIALALVLTFALAASSGLERFGRDWTPSVYRPTSLAAVADEYSFDVGNVTLDLRSVDFTGQTQAVTASMKLGQLRILLPPTVDASVTAGVDGGRVVLFGEEYNDSSTRQADDLGADGAGGGTLQLDVRVEAGNLEVIR